MNNKLNKPLGIILAVALIVATVVWFMGDDLEHIEDTNGADNYELTTITDEQIVDKSVGSLNVKTETGALNGMVTVSSDKFTGVYEVMYNNYVGSSDCMIQLYDFTVSSGNFKMVVVHDGEIVATLEPDSTTSYSLENISGTVSLIIAGESAEFSFSMAETDYDAFAHD